MNYLFIDVLNDGFITFCMQDVSHEGRKISMSSD